MPKLKAQSQSTCLRGPSTHIVHTWAPLEQVEFESLLAERISDVGAEDGLDADLGGLFYILT